MYYQRFTSTKHIVQPWHCQKTLSVSTYVYDVAKKFWYKEFLITGSPWKSVSIKNIHIPKFIFDCYIIMRTNIHFELMTSIPLIENLRRCNIKKIIIKKVPPNHNKISAPHIKFISFSHLTSNSNYHSYLVWNFIFTLVLLASISKYIISFYRTCND